MLRLVLILSLPVMQNLEKFISTNSTAIHISELPVELVKEIQSLLKITVDGIVGNNTKQAFIDFKSDKNLEYPLFLGVTTAKELLELQDKEECSANETDKVDSQPSMMLPGGKTVYANTLIVDNVPLTWGEATKDCTRVPMSSEHVANAIRLARTWGEVRDKFGSPIRITSGYRPPAVNKSIGGVRNSQHIYFKALDMQPVNGDFRRLWQVLLSSNFTGLGDAVFMGRNKGFFHADIRPSGRVIFPY
jgi:hypothetical protein